MNKLKVFFLAMSIAVSGLALSSCYAGGAVEVTAETPRLVWIGDGVWVVEDYPYAVYYYDNYYWRMIDGVWYRSTWYTDGWVRWSVTPRPIVRVYRPGVYRHYRAPRRARVRPMPDRRRAPRRAPVRDRRRRR